MNIFVTSNNAYFPQLMVFISTVSKCVSEKINLTVLYSDLCEKSIKKATKYAVSKGLSIKFKIVSDPRSSSYQLIYHLTRETYYRFLVMDIYPNEDRALWIDVDTVILKDFAPFYHLDFKNAYIAGVNGNNYQRHLKRLGLNENGSYINAGVILFNLKLIRKDFEKDFLHKCYEENENRLLLSDQDVINIAFADHIKSMPDRRYNFFVTHGQKFDRETYSFFKREVAIVHYIRHIKPWQKEYAGKLKHQYRKAMFLLFPFRVIRLEIMSFFYIFKRNKKTLENSKR